MDDIHLEVNRLQSGCQAEQTLSICGSSGFLTSNPTGESVSVSSIIIQPAKVLTNNPQDFRRYRQQAFCSTCQQQITTQTEHRIGGGAWIMCCIVFFIGGFLGCCCIPFCMRSCKDVVHHCPICNRIVDRHLAASIDDGGLYIPPYC